MTVRVTDIYAVSLDGTVIGGVTGQTVGIQSTVGSEFGDGAVYPTINTLNGQAPGISFQTRGVAAALDQSALIGWAISGAGFLAFGQHHAAGGTREGASSHRQYKITEGMVVPRSISVTHQGDAVISYDAIASYDGTNQPILVTDSVTLPSIDSGDDERFTLGPVTLSGTTLTGVKSMEIDFGMEVATEGGDSDIWDRFVSIRRTAPIVTFRGIDVDWFAADTGEIDLNGTVCVHADTDFYLRKREHGGTYVADVTAEHIKFTADGLAVVDTGMDGQTNTPAETAVTLHTRWTTGPTLPLVIDTTSAIT